MPTLQRAIALEEIDAIAVRIREDLDLDVSRLRQIFLEQQRVVAEGGFRFALGAGDRVGKLSRGAHNAHPLATATRRSFDQHRIADALGFRTQCLEILGCTVIAGNERHAGGLIKRFDSAFEPMTRIASMGGPMKTTPACAQASANSAFSDRKP